MPGAAAPYLVSIAAMLFSGLSALTLIHIVRHFDPPEVPPLPKQVTRDMAA